jgi:hypothetical protein
MFILSFTSMDFFGHSLVFWHARELRMLFANLAAFDYILFTIVFDTVERRYHSSGQKQYA